MTRNRERFVLELEALEDSVPVPVRLRRLLKIALRTLRLRCTRIVPAGSDVNVDDSEATP